MMRRTIIFCVVGTLLLAAYAFLARSSTLTPEQAALPDFGTTTVSHNGVQNAAARERFLKAYRAAQAGRWEAIFYSTEGDPIYNYVLYSGNGTQIQVVYDARQDQFGQGRVTLYTCEALVEEDRFLIFPNCSAGSDQASITFGIPMSY